MDKDQRIKELESKLLIHRERSQSYKSQYEKMMSTLKFVMCMWFISVMAQFTAGMIIG